MDLSPQQVRSTSFKTVKKGFDPTEVKAFQDSVAAAVESAQNQAMAMEARARAAVSKLQELSAHSPEPSTLVASPNDSDTISRTLLLAQRTADSTVADARLEASNLSSDAKQEAAGLLEGARTAAAKLIDEAKVEGRRSADTERLKAEAEVQALLAKRDFLVSDVDHLEQFLVAQRERLRDAAVSLHALVERVPGGLAEMRRPLLSAVVSQDITAEIPALDITAINGDHSDVTIAGSEL